jgi:hypothetical protein
MNDGLAVEMHNHLARSVGNNVIATISQVLADAKAQGLVADHGCAPVADADTERAHQVRLNERETLISAMDDTEPLIGGDWCAL